MTIHAPQPSFFEQGFRPFFFSASLFAAFAVPVWLAMYAMGYQLPSIFEGLDWHIHEMIFGFFAAILTGFLLTASPNWTGRDPISGVTLAALFGLWLAGRLALAFGGLLGEGFDPVARIIDIAFMVVVSVIIWREILAGKNMRNIPICGLVSVVAIANMVFHAEMYGWLNSDYGQRLGLGLIAFLISLIGGRVIPAFTRNWMVQKDLSPLPTLFSGYDKIVLAATLLILVAWVTNPDIPYLGLAFIAIGVLHGLRILRWSGWKTGTEPLVLILHVGYTWLIVAFFLMGISLNFADILLWSSALHALTAGAVGTMTIAIMSRASLGHAGLPLMVTPATLMSYCLISGGALLRVFAYNLPFDPATMFTIGGLLWSGGYLVFIISYSTIFIPRLAANQPAG